MRIIGVIDIRGGRAVRAVAGARSTYASVGDVAGVPVNGDAVALARVYVERLGVRELYVADLDAIGNGSSALNASHLHAIADVGTPVMVDAGVSSSDDAARILEAGASSVVVGLETLTDFAALDAICSQIGGERVSFSIDLRDGRLLAAPNVMASFRSVADVARRAADSGVGALIVLDLARVGTGAGIELEMVRAIKGATPSLTLIAGGGVRDGADLDALRDAGCDGALVATALQRGLLSSVRGE